MKLTHKTMLTLKIYYHNEATKKPFLLMAHPTLIERFLHDPNGKYRACAGAILVNGSRQLLICRRNTDKFEAWQFPQGGVEGEETDFKTAAAREATEELGISHSTLGHVQAIPQVFYYQAPADSWLVQRGFKGQAISFSLFRF